MTISTSKERVPAHTADSVNRQLQLETVERVRRAAQDPALIGQRLAQLDDEWDIERAIEANASILAFVGILLGYFVHPYWLALPALVAAFLFQHAIQGWCPPVPVLRRLGFRTVYEIEEERHALKALRGDYAAVASAQDKAAKAMTAAEM